MKNKINVISYIMGVLLCVLAVHADDSKGYKIILSSFASLDEANTSMHTLASRFGNEEIALQKEEKYSIVARASGKTFILAIEPLSSRESAERVKKAFDKFYSGSYINGYFGPTEGALVWKAQNEPSLKHSGPSNAQTDSSISSTPELVDEKRVMHRDRESQQSFSWSLIFIIVGAVIILSGLLYFRTRLTAKKRIMTENADRPVSTNSISKEEHIEAIQVFSQLEVKSDHETFLETHNGSKQDIFFKLQKNIFFKTLLDELNKAARIKNEQRCKEVMEEIYKYQKNFRQSEKITLLQQCIESKDFDRLVELITT